ncbi:gephyrin-like molybdotransferase Glp [Tropicimonas isoalkanivorans]|uniref:Molybdopterin molybdenumtransferase n=1 Tax=Tropicimonas isoalkanivorans TaxID=441112 RepID=A0A1I1DZ06_9RHOB|nr:gephyrin-like molybdotransferase Glp [Tropicimonas isoalkanivorans]SFB80165.1 molybdopterin molybdotransferase [Tropicimonas isoalkanivorans]
MIPVSEALEKIFALVAPVGTERVPLSKAAGRVLAEPVVARRAQPPFAASAMDGYALRAAEVTQGARFRVIGAAPAGEAFAGTVGAGEAVRIFTGAPVPDGADMVVIQENTARDGDVVTITDPDRHATNIRPAGGDFAPGDRMEAPRRLSPADVMLAAAMNVPDLVVSRRPVVALLATGNELVMPGEEPRDDQIVACNGFGLKALFEAAGAEARLLPIARDDVDSLRTALGLTDGADLIVTIGGASVGDHDLVAGVAADLGLEAAFHKVAMRPGKPLLAGRLGDVPMVGVPGNPVSAMVCGHIFLRPMLLAMQGLVARPAPRVTAALGADVAENGPREHYMRAILADGVVTPFDSQDSALLGVLSQSNALLVRPVADPSRKAGEMAEVVPI